MINIAAEDADADGLTEEEFKDYNLKPSVKAVLIAMDHSFNYSKLAVASLYVHQLGARFLAVDDQENQKSGDLTIPSVGSFSRSISIVINKSPEII